MASSPQIASSPPLFTVYRRLSGRDGLFSPESGACWTATLNMYWVISIAIETLFQAMCALGYNHGAEIPQSLLPEEMPASHRRSLGLYSTPYHCFHLRHLPLWNVSRWISNQPWALLLETVSLPGDSTAFSSLRGTLCGWFPALRLGDENSTSHIYSTNIFRSRWGVQFCLSSYV